MKSFKIIGLLLLPLSITTPFSVFSDDLESVSYQANAPINELGEKVDNLVLWAKGELAEHSVEGLFFEFKDEKMLIEDLIVFAEELKGHAKKAQENNDMRQVRKYLIAAESIATQAAHLPHLLEESVKSKK